MIGILREGKFLLKRGLFFLSVLILTFLPFTINAQAHPGGLDGNGGHYCRTNCAKWGLKNGQYHYHNADGSVSLTKPSAKPAPKPVPKPAPLSIYIDGVKQTYDVPPIVENGRTLVPLRGIFESLGATVNWNQKQQLVTARHAKTTISLKIGSKSPKVNGKVVPIEVPAKITNGRTLVPIRFVSESLGATVNYNASSKTITITSKNLKR